MPRLVFGSIEEDPGTRDPPLKLLNRTHFETLRWKYHAPWQDKRNHLQKVIVDISKIPAHDSMMGDHSYSVHPPSRALCPEESFDIRINDTKLHPLSANHYLGSWERYHSRKNDKRRRRKVRLVGWLVNVLRLFL
jgi:hypothetical protein